MANFWNLVSFEMNTNNGGWRKTVKATVFRLAVGISDIAGAQPSSGINFISKMSYLSLDFDLLLNKLCASFCFVCPQKLTLLEHPLVFPILFFFLLPKRRNWSPLVSGQDLLLFSSILLWRPEAIFMHRSALLPPCLCWLQFHLPSLGWGHGLQNTH